MEGAALFHPLPRLTAAVITSAFADSVLLDKCLGLKSYRAHLQDVTTDRDLTKRTTLISIALFTSALVSKTKHTYGCDRRSEGRCTDSLQAYES